MLSIGRHIRMMPDNGLSAGLPASAEKTDSKAN